MLVGRRRDAREVASFIPDCIVLFKRLLGDPRVPRRAKVAVVLLVPYLALPFDLVPDFVPVAGQLDDAILVALVVAYVVRVAGRGVVAELWPGGERGLRAVCWLRVRLRLEKVDHRAGLAADLDHVDTAPTSRRDAASNA